ncbi:MAG: DUF5034 domain-containing protein [Pedobacter sp.]|nr:MAG: DUF5034 domain-containing protein [Pedobacter sp.]
MIKKIFFVLALALISQLIVSCVDCNCLPIKTVYYTNKALLLKNMDFSLAEPRISNAGIISGANFGIQIQLQTEMIISYKMQVKWGFMQPAYACSCPEDNFIAKDNIASLTIFSNNDFDVAHPKNTDLSLYFKAKRNNVMVPITDYIATINDQKYGYPNNFYEGIFLQTMPTSNKKHKFKVVITLTDGRILEAETTEIELN